MMPFGVMKMRTAGPPTGLIAISTIGLSGLGTGVGDPGVAQYRLQTTGQATTYETTGDGLGGSVTTDISGEWLVSGANSDYECRATLISGTLSSGTLDTWQLLSTERSWSRTRTTVGVNAVSFTLEIRRVSDGAVLDTCTINLTAEV